LNNPASRVRLSSALAGVDRLVLLGDVVELREGPVRDALAAASRVLREVGESLGPGREVVVLPGNHDHYLLEGWLGRRSAAGPPEPLGLESSVEWWGEEPLAVLADALASGGATVRAAYPGVWLRDDVYATHGHYLDRHTTVPMFERLGAGAMARVLRRPIGDAHQAEDYEAVLSPLYAWVHAIAQSAGQVGASAPGASAQVWQSVGKGVRKGGLRRRAVIAGLGGGIATVNRLGLGPVGGDLSPAELRRANLRAFGEVLTALSVDSHYAIFGHSHRAGPLPADGPGEWIAPTGARIFNTGCWVHEPAFLGSHPLRSPYRAGFAVRLEDDGPPELVNLLD
jgi:hypothetical protein